MATYFFMITGKRPGFVAFEQPEENKERGEELLVINDQFKVIDNKLRNDEEDKLNVGDDGISSDESENEEEKASNIGGKRSDSQKSTNSIL